MPETPTEDRAVGLVQAVVVSVEYSGHDCQAKIESVWGTFEQAQARVDELTKANEDFGDEQHFALDFPPAVLL